MIISIIAALDEKGGIGWRNRVPWHISSDLRRFKKLTMGHILILGRKTYESIGRPLPGRNMIVISRDPGCSLPGVIVCHSLHEALALAEAQNENEVFIGGGGNVYEQALPLTNRMYLTFVHTSVPVDVFFPDYSAADWQVTEKEEFPAGDMDQFAYTYIVLDRIVPI